MDAMIATWALRAPGRVVALIEDTANGTTYLQSRAARWFRVEQVAPDVWSPCCWTPRASAPALAGDARGPGSRSSLPPVTGTRPETTSQSRPASCTLRAPLRAARSSCPTRSRFLGARLGGRGGGFPRAAHDDDADATSQCFCAGPSTAARRPRRLHRVAERRGLTTGALRYPARMADDPTTEMDLLVRLDALLGQMLGGMGNVITGEGGAIRPDQRLAAPAVRLLLMSNSSLWAFAGVPWARLICDKPAAGSHRPVSASRRRRACPLALMALAAPTTWPTSTRTWASPPRSVSPSSGARLFGGGGVLIDVEGDTDWSRPWVPVEGQTLRLHAYDGIALRPVIASGGDIREPGLPAIWCPFALRPAASLPPPGHRLHRRHQPRHPLDAGAAPCTA